MRIHPYIWLCMMVLLFGCREPFDGFDFVGSGSKLVIEAIVTDTGEDGYVRISYADPINGGEIQDFLFEAGASVTLVDDQGGEVIFRSQGEGLYANRSFRAEFGKKYQMRVSIGPNSYQSDWQALALATSTPTQPEYRPDTVQLLNDLGTPVDQLSVTISDQLQKSDKDLHYYWQLKYYYIYDAYGQPDVADLLPEARRFCYVQQIDEPELVLYKDFFIDGLNNTDFSLDISTIPFGRKFVYDYSVQVTRFTVSPSVYGYFERIQNQIQNSGGVFDAAPSSIQGNFERTSGSLEVLGYFGVFNASSQRLFLNQDELPFDKLYFPTDAASCPGHHAVELSNTCFNCTAVASLFNTPTKPVWWR